MNLEKEFVTEATGIDHKDSALNQATTVATDFTTLSAGPENKNQDYSAGKLSPTKKDDRKLFVGGIARSLTDKSFREFFEQFGTVVDSIVMVDRFSKTSRGFGFVTFEDGSVAKQLLNGGSNKDIEPPAGGHKSCKMMIHGRMCEIKLSEPKKIESHSNMSSQSSLTVPDQIQFQNGAPLPVPDALLSSFGYYSDRIHHSQHDASIPPVPLMPLQQYPVVDQSMTYYPYPVDQQQQCSHITYYDPYYYQYPMGTYVTPVQVFDAYNNSIQHEHYGYPYSQQELDHSNFQRNGEKK